MNTPSMISSDAYDADILANAKRFAASLFLGRGKFANADSETLEGIQIEAARLLTENPDCTRKPIIVAFDSEGNQAAISGKAYKAKGKNTPSLSASVAKIFGAAKPAKAPKAPKAEKPAKAPKAPKAPKADKPAKADDAAKGERKLHPKHQAMIDAAAKGKLPEAPDFTAETHKSYRKKLEAIVAMAKKGDIEGLKADTTEPKCSTRTPLCRYRDYAILALETRAAKASAKAE